MYFNGDFTRRLSFEYVKYDIGKYYDPKSSISIRKVYVKMFLKNFEICYSSQFNSSMRLYYSMNFNLILLLRSQITLAYVYVDTFDSNTSDRTRNCKSILNRKCLKNN